jgi:hypothetical protein
MTTLSIRITPLLIKLNPIIFLSERGALKVFYPKKEVRKYSSKTIAPGCNIKTSHFPSIRKTFMRIAKMFAAFLFRIYVGLRK